MHTQGQKHPLLVLLYYCYATTAQAKGLHSLCAPGILQIGIYQSSIWCFAFVVLQVVVDIKLCITSEVICIRSQSARRGLLSYTWALLML